MTSSRDATHELSDDSSPGETAASAPAVIDVTADAPAEGSTEESTPASVDPAEKEQTQAERDKNVRTATSRRRTTARPSTGQRLHDAMTEIVAADNDALASPAGLLRALQLVAAGANPKSTGSRGLKQLVGDVGGDVVDRAQRTQAVLDDVCRAHAGVWTTDRVRAAVRNPLSPARFGSGRAGASRLRRQIREDAGSALVNDELVSGLFRGSAGQPLPSGTAMVTATQIRTAFGAARFVANDIRDGVFESPEGAQTVDMMRTVERLPHARIGHDGWVVDIPASDRLVLRLVLPPHGMSVQSGLAALIHTVPLTARTVAIALPRVHVAQVRDVTPALKTLGVESMADAGSLPRFDGAGLDSVVQLNELQIGPGTQARDSLTFGDVDAADRIVRSRPTVIEFDRPFAFSVLRPERGRLGKIPVMQGVVSNPCVEATESSAALVPVEAPRDMGAALEVARWTIAGGVIDTTTLEHASLS